MGVGVCFKKKKKKKKTSQLQKRKIFGWGVCILIIAGCGCDNFGSWGTGFPIVEINAIPGLMDVA